MAQRAPWLLHRRRRPSIKLALAGAIVPHCAPAPILD
jgi:hypothetical protein